MSRRTIQSPGIEIREIDLTQRPAAAVGTSVFIAGFSNQGPTDEVFNVGTFAEFEEIYGSPTNAAERYFYHSARQVFNSDANVFVSRLPYGANKGIRKYSALVYPVVGLNTATISAFTPTTLDIETTAVSALADCLSGDNLAIELTVKDSNDNLSFISTTVSGYSGSHSLSAGVMGTVAGHRIEITDTIPYTPTGALQTLSASLVDKTLVTGQIWSQTVSAIGGVDQFSSSLSASNYYVIGQPTLVSLDEDEYNNAKEGNVTWSDAGSAGSNAVFTGDFTSAAGAGIIVLNTGGTVTNNEYEGYYVGMTDGRQTNPATNFTSVTSVFTTTTTNATVVSSEFATIPTSRLGFELSGSYVNPKSNVSRTLETLSQIDIDGPEFQDTINVGVFKIRNTPFSNTELELTNFLAEGYTGSLDSRRKVQDDRGGAKKSLFIENVENGSPNVKILVNPNISDHSGSWTSTKGDAPTKTVRVTNGDAGANAAAIEKLWWQGPLGTGWFGNVGEGGSETHRNFDVTKNGLYPLGVFHSTDNITKSVGSIPDKLDRIFEIAENVDVFQIDVSIEAGLGTVHTFAKATGATTYNNTGVFRDTDYIDIGSGSTGFFTPDQNMQGSTQIDFRDNYRTIFNRFETFARQTRKDHIFIADALRPLVVQGDNGKVLDDKTKHFSKHVYWPLRHQFGTANSNFATTYGNWAKVWDGTSGKQIWIPFSGVAAKIFAQNDAAYAPWFAPAGFNRGIVSGVNDIAVSPTQRQRDQLYRIAINPVTQFPAEGIVIFGQKTLQRKPTAFDRINVRRLFLDLEKRTRQTLKFFVFEPNTFLTRNKVVNTLTPMFENCKQTEGIYDYLIVCDDRNNPASVIDENELRVDIYLKPVRAAEFILVNFYAVNTDVNFQEIVGQ